MSLDLFKVISLFDITYTLILPLVSIEDLKVWYPLSSPITIQYRYLKPFGLTSTGIYPTVFHSSEVTKLTFAWK